MRALRTAMAEEHRAKDRALEAGDADEAITAWLQAMHATRRASHAVRSGRAASAASSGRVRVDQVQVQQHGGGHDAEHADVQDQQDA